MSEWIDVPVAEVAVGDSVKIKGYGRRHDSAFTFGGHESYPVVSVAGDDVTVDWMQGIPAPERYVSIVRSSIVAARRRKPEPQPKPGDWRCSEWDGFTRTYGPCHNPKHESREVYRSGSGWSRDTRTGQPWVMKTGDPVEVVVEATAGTTVGASLRMAWADMEPRENGEPLTHYYKRIGLDVRPVERRGKQ